MKRFAVCSQCHQMGLHFTRKKGTREGQVLSFCCDCRRVRAREQYRENSLDPVFRQERAARRREQRVGINWNQHLRARDPERYYVGGLLAGSRARAKRHGWLHTLTRDWITSRLRNGCPVTGLPFHLTGPTTATRNPRSPSIDRIDPAKGYLQENCRIVMTWYNVAKNDYDDETVFELMTAAVQQRTR